MFGVAIDFSLIFVALALFGFLLEDAFNWGQRVPGIYASAIKQFFHYISISIITLSYFIVIFMLIAVVPQPNPATSSLYFIESMEKAGIFDQGTAISILKSVAMAFLPALAYILIFFIVLIFGVIWRLSRVVWVKVTFNDNKISKYPSILYQDKDFIIFEQYAKGKYWRAIRKEDIKMYEEVSHKSKFSIMIHDLKVALKQGNKQFLIKLLRDYFIIAYVGVMLLSIIIIYIVQQILNFFHI